MLRQLLQALQHTSNTTLLDGGGDVIEGGGEDTEEEELTYIPYSQRPETYIVPVIFGIIFLVGVIGNSCLIYILLRHKSMRSVPNTFIFNLAVGDLLVLLCSVPFSSTVYTFEVYISRLLSSSSYACLYNDINLLCTFSVLALWRIHLQGIRVCKGIPYLLHLLSH